MSGTNPLPAGQWANIASLGGGTLAAGNLAGLATGASNARPLRGPPASFVRQPYLGSAPAVSAVSGFGTGSGGYILNNGSDADQSQGLVAVQVGLNPATSGTVVLSFPIAPPAGGYSFFAEWGTLTASLAGNVATINWTSTQPLVTGQRLLLAYQWTVSQ